jgi:alpha-L-fucosidase
LTVNGAGGTPGEQVLIVLHSDPVQLGTATVGANGTFQTAVVIPKNTEIGQHTIEVVGVSCGVTTSVPLTVIAPPGSAAANSSAAFAEIGYDGPMALSYTGVNTTAALLMGIGLVSVGGFLSVVYRRRPVTGRHRG